MEVYVVLDCRDYYDHPPRRRVLDEGASECLGVDAGRATLF
jgi:hypothetical protein